MSPASAARVREGPRYTVPPVLFDPERNGRAVKVAAVLLAAVFLIGMFVLGGVLIFT